MGEGFEHLRCPMCGSELIYSDGTHDLCCVKNPYESEAAGGALHEERAEYGDEKNSHIYKVWGEMGEGGRLKRKVAQDPAQIYGERISTSPLPFPVSGMPPLSRTLISSVTSSSEATDPSLARDRPLEGEGIGNTGDAGSAAELFTGNADNTQALDTPVKGHAKGSAAYVSAGEVSAGDAGNAHISDIPVNTHKCVFAVSFTESARFGTLWSVRVVHGETNYFALMRLMQKIEKRRLSGEPLASNAPHQPKRRERSPAARLAFRYGIEEEDVYSIKFSSETVKRLAVFYGISERDVRRIREEELGEE
jgi:hypothetical protein